MVRAVSRFAGPVLLILSCAAMAQPSASLKMRFDEETPPPETRVTQTALVRKQTAPPVTDGIVDEDVWRSATALDPLYESGDPRRAFPATTVRVFHAGDVIYFGVISAEPDPARLNADAPPEDGILLIFNSRNDRRALQVIAVSVSGDLASYALDGEGKKSPWESKSSAAVVRGDQSWSMEVAVPRASLETPANDLIAFNMARRRSGTDGAPFVWNPCVGTVEDGRFCGLLSLETPPCSVQQVGIGWPYAGINRFRVQVRNTASQDVPLIVNVLCVRAGREAERGEYRITAPAHLVAEYALPHRIAAAGVCDLRFTLTDAAGKTMAQFARVGVAVNAAPITMTPPERIGDGTAWTSGFRILMPSGDLGDLRLHAVVRQPKTFQGYGQADPREARSRAGTLTVDVARLPPGDYEVVLSLVRDGRFVGRAIQPLIITAPVIEAGPK